MPTAKITRTPPPIPIYVEFWEIAFAIVPLFDEVPVPVELVTPLPENEPDMLPEVPLKLDDPEKLDDPD